jgi:hypothetical protein
MYHFNMSSIFSEEYGSGLKIICYRVPFKLSWLTLVVVSDIAPFIFCSVLLLSNTLVLYISPQKEIE